MGHLDMRYSGCTEEETVTKIWCLRCSKKWAEQQYRESCMGQVGSTVSPPVCVDRQEKAVGGQWESEGGLEPHSGGFA